MAGISTLLLGVIRDASLYRANNAGRALADAEYKARRPGVMKKGEYRCVFCGYISRKYNECHHLDGNHANNTDENMVVVDTLCHGYQHVGQRASQEPFAADNLGGAKSLVAVIPESAATDLTLLQRAIGAALKDDMEAPIAEEMIRQLGSRATPVRDAFGSWEVGDFGAAMSKLDDQTYEHRGSVIGGLRLLFRKDVLINEGDRFIKDSPALPVSSWGDIEKNATTSSPSKQ